MNRTYIGTRYPDSRGAQVAVSDEDPDFDFRHLLPLRHYIRHSPDGFEWGYGGSGPAELARCILIDALGGDEERADRLYQDFKWALIAPIQDDSWTLPLDGVLHWVEKYEQSRVQV